MTGLEYSGNHAPEPRQWDAGTRPWPATWK